MDEAQQNLYARRDAYNALVRAWSMTPGLEAQIHSREFWAQIDRQCSPDEVGFDRSRLQREQAKNQQAG